MRGGLGNQFIQITAAHVIATKLDSRFFIEPFFLSPLIQRILSVTPRKLVFQGLPLHTSCICNYFAAKCRSRLGINPGSTQIIQHIDQVIPIDCSHIILDGYFQDPSIFSRQNDSAWLSSYELLLACTGNGLSIERSQQSILNVHIRKGDYLNLKNIYHDIGSTYYLESIVSFCERYPNIAEIHFHTDTPAWVIRHVIPLIVNYSPLDGIILKMPCLDELDTFKSLCGSSYTIIANSSFSLAAAHISQILNPLARIMQPTFWFTGAPNPFADVFPC